MGEILCAYTDAELVLILLKVDAQHLIITTPVEVTDILKMKVAKDAVRSD